MMKLKAEGKLDEALLLAVTEEEAQDIKKCRVVAS